MTPLAVAPPFPSPFLEPGHLPLYHTLSSSIIGQPFLRETASVEGSLVINNVTPSALLKWESLHPELQEADQVKYEYNSLTQKVVFKCLPTPIHDATQIHFLETVMSGFIGTKARGKLRVGSGTEFIGFAGDYAYSSKKLPDAYVRVGDDPTYPTVVAESGWSEDLTDLIQDARLWLIGSKLRTRVVIIVAFTETKKSAAGKRDSRLEFDLISSATQVKDLAKGLLELNRKGEISPLLGTIKATFHAYRLNSQNNLYECYKEVVLPAPTDEYTGGHKGDARPSFSLTMQDLFGLNPVPEGVDPEHKIVFNMDEFRKIISEQIPAIEHNRSIGRASTILESRGFPEVSVTFAATNSGERK